jgi:hypothetical protein
LEGICFGSCVATRTGVCVDLGKTATSLKGTGMWLAIIIIAWIFSLVLFTYKASKIYFKKGVSRGIGVCNTRMNFLRKMSLEIIESANDDEVFPMADVGDTVEMVSSYLVSHDEDSCDYHLRRFFKDEVVYFQKRVG